MSNQEFVAMGGTKFNIQGSSNSLLWIAPKDARHTTGLPLADLLDFADYVRGLSPVELPALPEPVPPLSRRTEVLGMMAATILAADAARSLSGSASQAVSDAKQLLTAIEEGDKETR